MRVLIAEDDNAYRKLLETNLAKWGYEIIMAEDGNQAWEILSKDDAPNLAVLDWMMPGMDGVEVCKKVRGRERGPFTYLILLTAKSEKENVLSGFDAGADDYIVKPFDRLELKARLSVGERMVNLELNLRSKILELTKALSEVKQLQGMIPICAWCKKIRDDDKYWHNVEEYIAKRSTIEFSHSICPDCEQEYFKE